jgi:preprotein translocase subunit SecA
LVKGHIPISNPEQVREAEARRHTDMSRMSVTKSEVPGISSHTGEHQREREPQKANRSALKNGLGETTHAPAEAERNLRLATEDLAD